MSRYIDAEWLKELYKPYESYNGKEFAVPIGAILANIDDAPTIDIKPKRGEWLWDNGYFCSECHGEAFSQKFTMLIDDPMYFRSDFCPHCGADMRERESE